MKIYVNIEIEQDGDQFCAHFHDFVNLHETSASEVAFGSTPTEAFKKLAESTQREL
jgi:hypothetical protein